MQHIFIGFRCRGDRQLLIEVQDDGRGFDSASAKVSGLRGLADRIEALGGRMEVSRGKARGTLLRAWLPLEERVNV